jgi:hypothetical protein
VVTAVVIAMAVTGVTVATVAAIVTEDSSQK